MPAQEHRCKQVAHATVLSYPDVIRLGVFALVVVHHQTGSLFADYTKDVGLGMRHVGVFLCHVDNLISSIGNEVSPSPVGSHGADFNDVAFLYGYLQRQVVARVVGFYWCAYSPFVLGDIAFAGRHVGGAISRCGDVAHRLCESFYLARELGQLFSTGEDGIAARAGGAEGDAVEAFNGHADGSLGGDVHPQRILGPETVAAQQGDSQQENNSFHCRCFF